MYTSGMKLKDWWKTSMHGTALGPGLQTSQLSGHLPWCTASPSRGPKVHVEGTAVWVGGGWERSHGEAGWNRCQPWDPSSGSVLRCLGTEIGCLSRPVGRYRFMLRITHAMQCIFFTLTARIFHSLPEPVTARKPHQASFLLSGSLCNSSCSFL